ncbi:Lar family restriction alleviation protein [Variovorax sp. GT1P44]|uniref:Lar family restriction alleviation protein n=1 Tax=Variovorax sp. GT1P44 TaxID=3443742 RepID=UPI003F47ECF6
MKDLLPCPFCGGKASICKSKGESLWSHDIVTWTHVECSECESQTRPTCPGWEPDAITTWNRRVALSEET